jgi:hypothetical protein
MKIFNQIERVQEGRHDFKKIMPNFIKVRIFAIFLNFPQSHLILFYQRIGLDLHHSLFF